MGRDSTEPPRPPRRRPSRWGGARRRLTEEPGRAGRGARLPWPPMGRRVLVIDNYDSFVYNLVQYLGELGAEPLVHRHDALTLAAGDRRSTPTAS